MISDVLFDAVEEIENYQRDLPEAYENWRSLIAECKDAMRSLQKKLDDPYFDPRESAPTAIVGA
jgi:hypothetical protein